MNSRRDFLKKCGRIGLGVVMVPVISSLSGCETTTTSSTFTVENDKCTGCGDCLNSCNHDAIALVDKKAVITQSDCIGCGKCVSYCDSSAIIQSID